MLTSLALIFLVGLASATICRKIHLPRIIGMLVTGILLGPYVLDFLDSSILGVSFLLLAVEDWLEGIVPVSGLLAIMSMSMVIAMRSVPSVAQRLREKYGKLWLAAELILFVMVGAAVDIRYTLQAGLGAVWMILLALVFRSFGVWLCLVGTKFSHRERLYYMIAYLPKATVQAAIGSVPLSLGLPCGRLVLSVTILAVKMPGS